MSQESEPLPEKAAYPLRIFFSYGHRDHTEKVKAIKAALEARGHKVWLDIDGGINPGNDWRRRIQQGIRDSQMVMAFLSKYAMREDGVCRDELQIAIGCQGGNIKTVLFEPWEKVCPPATITHSQCLDLSKWDGNSAELPIVVEKIARMIETEDNFIFNDEINQLRQILNPWENQSRIQELYSPKMYGRQWLCDVLKEWDEANKSQLFWMVGGAGFGKSMFSANLCLQLCDKVVAAQFIEWDKPNIYEPTALLKSLAYQLAKRYPDYRKHIIDLPAQARNKLSKSYEEGGYAEEELFDLLFCKKDAFAINGERESAWVILDALDEATKNGENSIARTLARHLGRIPKWLKFILTSRDDDAVRSALGSFKPNVYDVSKEVREHQEEDMLEYLKDILASRNFSQNTLQTLVRKSSGMFLYLRFACEHILEKKLKEDEIANLPDGIQGIYFSYFERQFGGEKSLRFKDNVRPILALCRSAYEALPLDFLAEALGWDMETLQTSISFLGTLKIDREENGKSYFHFCHKSIWDWLESLPKDPHSFRVDRTQGLGALINFCLKKIEEYNTDQIVKDPNCEYPLRHIIRHLVEQGNETKIWDLMSGADPLLPKIQKDYFGDRSVALNSCRQAVLFYCDLYQKPEIKKIQILPRISRLIITYKKLLAEQQEQLRYIFNKHNSLEKALDILNTIPDARKAFVVGCYLLGQAKERNWDIDVLIDGIVKKCGDDINALDWDDLNFLCNGPLSDAVPNLKTEQLTRLLNVIHDPVCKKEIPEGIRDRLQLPQLREAYWYFDKLDNIQRGRLAGPVNDLAAEKTRINAIEDLNDRCVELVNLATSLYVHHQPEAAMEAISQAEALLPEIDSKWRVDSIVEFYHFTGQNQKAGQVLLANQKAFGDNHDDHYGFASKLCECTLNKEAYKFFEENFFPSSEDGLKFLEDCVSTFGVLKKMAENGQWDAIAEFLHSNVMYLDCSKWGNSLLGIFEMMDKSGQLALASQLLHEAYEKCADKADCLLKKPKLVPFIEKCAEKDYWPDSVPSLKEALDSKLSPPDGKVSLSNYEKLSQQVLTENFSHEIQLDFIQRAWNCFLEEKDGMPQDNLVIRQGVFQDIESILTAKSEDEIIRPYVREFLQTLQKEPINIQSDLTKPWLGAKWINEEERGPNCAHFGDTLLLDTLPENEIEEYFQSFQDRLLKEDINSREISIGLKSLLFHYLVLEDSEGFLGLLTKINHPKKGKLSDAVATFSRVISEITDCRSKYKEQGQWQFPECYIGILAELKPYFDEFSLSDMPYHCDDLLENLSPYREQCAALQFAHDLLDILDSKIRQSPQGKEPGQISHFINSGAWCLDRKRFNSWFAKMEEPPSRWSRRNGDGNWYRKLEAYLAYALKGAEPPKDWYSFAWKKINELHGAIDKKIGTLQLLDVASQKGTPEQVEEILTCLSSADLHEFKSELNCMDIFQLLDILHKKGASKNVIREVINVQNWEDLPFDKLCILAEALLDEDRYVLKWFRRLQEKLQEEDRFDILKEILVTCPELGFSKLFEEPKAIQAPASATPTASEIAALCGDWRTKLAQDILALRKRLAEEELTSKEYAKGFDALVNGLEGSLKAQIMSLEQQLNDGKITLKGYEEWLLQALTGESKE